MIMIQQRIIKQKVHNGYYKSQVNWGEIEGTLSEQQDLIDYIDNSIPTKTSELVNDNGFINDETLFKSSPAYGITQGNINLWNGYNNTKANRSEIEDMLTKTEARNTYQIKGDYLTQSDLNGYARTQDLPTKVSQLQNDLTFTTKSYVDKAIEDAAIGDLPNYYTKEEIDEKIPTKVSQLTNDSGYITDETIFKASPAYGISSNDITKWNGYELGKANVTDLADMLTKTLAATLYQPIGDYALESELSGKLDVSVYNTDKVTFALKSELPTKVSELTNDTGFITSSSIPTLISAFTNDVGYLTQHQDISNLATKSEVQAKQDELVSGTNIKTINNQSILGSGNITIQGGSENVQADWDQTDSTADDYIKNKPTIPTVPTNVSAFTNDAGYITSAPVQSVNGQTGIVVLNIPDSPVQSNWNETDNTSLAFIQNKPTIPVVPTNVSAFTNDAGYLTQHQSLSNYYTKSEVYNKTEIDNTVGDIDELLETLIGHTV